MKTNKTVWLVLLFAVVVFSGFGCSAHKADTAEFSGFMKNYNQLSPGTEESALYTYRDASVDLKPYDKVLLEKVRVYTSQNDDEGIDPDVLKEMVDYFTAALVRELTGGYELVDRAGPNTLHIRTALTDVIAGNSFTGTTASLIPVGMIVAGAKGASSGTGVGVGQAAAEMEILDSKSGKRIMAAVDHRIGGQAPFKGEMDDIKAAIDHWAKRLRTRLDQERGM